VGRGGGAIEHAGRFYLPDNGRDTTNVVDAEVVAVDPTSGQIQQDPSATLATVLALPDNGRPR